MKIKERLIQILSKEDDKHLIVRKIDDGYCLSGEQNPISLIDMYSSKYLEEYDFRLAPKSAGSFLMCGELNILDANIGINIFILGQFGIMLLLIKTE